MVRTQTNDNENGQLDLAAIIVQQLQNIIPHIVTQVTNNVNNENKNNNNRNNKNNNGNGGNNGCSYKGFQACGPKEYDGKGGAIALTRWIEKMENVLDNSECSENQKARGREAAIGMTWNDFKALLVEEFCPSNEMERLENKFWNYKVVGANHAAYTNRFHELAKLVPHQVTPESTRIKRKAISYGTLTKGNEKRKGVEETSKSGGSWRDNKKAKAGTGFVATAPPRNESVGPYSKLSAPFKQVAPVNVVKMGYNQRVCYECGSSDHLRNTCPRMNRAPGQAGNLLALEGNCNARNNGNRATERAFNVNVNAVESLRDLKVVTACVDIVWKLLVHQ
ncbi:reverse transcriptase domain-containing protein, partial [Tanacetum coccineum]